LDGLEKLPDDPSLPRAAFSFADGHVERWQWVGLTQEQPIFTAVTPAAQPDFQRLLNAVVFR